MNLYKYTSYNEYIKSQIAGNKKKFYKRWIREDDVEQLALYLMDHVDSLNMGMCHGTRGGQEQKWFEKYIPGCMVYGTEISSIARNCYHTCIWDFNKDRKRWHGKFSFIYSNSWDHAYNLPETIKIWLRSLKPDGYLILEASIHHAGIATKTDPIRMNVSELRKAINRWTNGEWYVTKLLKANIENIIDNGSVKKDIQSTFVIVRRKDIENEREKIKEMG